LLASPARLPAVLLAARIQRIKLLLPLRITPAGRHDREIVQ
jgi:hypothetical protein